MSPRAARTAAEPSREIALAGRAICTRCRREPDAEALLRGRCPCGAFLHTNTDSEIHKGRSTRHRAAMAPLHEEMRGAILADRGFTERDTPPRVLSTLVDQFCEARLIAATYFAFISENGGPITTKGRQRRAVDGYLKASDRVTKLAALIGLTREPRETTLDDWMQQTDEPNGGGTDESEANDHREHD